MDISLGKENQDSMDSTVFASESIPLPAPAKLGSRGILLLDQNNYIRSIDAGLCSLLGIDRSEVIGKNRLEAFRKVANASFIDANGFIASNEWLAEHPDELLEDTWEIANPAQRIIHRYSAPLHDEQNNIIGRVEVYSDITRRRELEEKVRQAYDELKTMQEQLIQSEKLRAIGEIASGIAHDFNNALGVILGNIQLLARNIEHPADLQRVKAIEQAALDAAETVRRIRQFTKQEMSESPSVLELSELVADVVNMLKPVWQDSLRPVGTGIDVQIDVLSKAFVLGVAAEIREVLANVLLNAIQAMPSGGKITISVGCDGNSAWVKVADTGVGMTEEVRKRIFDPFFTTRGVEGTGLGMSIAYGIVSRHHGTISVESEPGIGTVVTITLPSTSESVSEEKGNLPDYTQATRPAKILVVDDEEVFAQVIAEMLSECGHVACIARSGREAIEAFQRESFDLVLTDLGMPEMSGWQVARKVKEINPCVPVVLLTGWGASLDSDQLAESQIDGMLAKPVQMADLSTTISSALARKESG
jgi:signal transduction histidine kinase/ActR/RegA family two-component response regulator